MRLATKLPNFFISFTRGISSRKVAEIYATKEVGEVATVKVRLIILRNQADLGTEIQSLDCFRDGFDLCVT